MVAMDPALQLIMRGALALLLCWAAVHKLRNVAEFREALAAYELLPRRCVRAAAALLVASELAIGVTLLLPGIGAGAALGAAALLCTYAGAIGINLLRGRRHIDCGCVGAAARRPIGLALVARNGALVVIALASALPATSRRLTGIDALTVSAGVITVAFLYVAVDALIVNAPRTAALTRDRILVGAGDRRVEHA
jgi:Methylamine utilisation protein MauE